MVSDQLQKYGNKLHMDVNSYIINKLRVQLHVHTIYIHTDCHSGMCSLASDSTQSSECAKKRSSGLCVTVCVFGSPKLGQSLSYI